MFYKPKFCCQCGEKIDTVDWKLLTSRRFCELCATEFGLHDLVYRVVMVIALLFGLFGIGVYLQRPEKPLNIAQTQFVQSNKKTETNQNANAQFLSDNRVQTSAQQNTTATETQSPPTNLKIKQAIQPPIVEAAEKVYFCGAPTKKGTMCSRRVRNGGRCWQHQGQDALLPQEKLLAVAQ